MKYKLETFPGIRRLRPDGIIQFASVPRIDRAAAPAMPLHDSARTGKGKMLGMSCIEAYEKQYPADRCGVDEWEDRLVIESADGARAVREPAGETGETFMNRLARSRDENRNLFFDEWTVCLTEADRLEEKKDAGIAPACIEAYRRQYPEDDIRPAVPGKPAVIYWEDPRYPGGRFTLIEPSGETNKSFFERLERSRQEGRNLFHEEWVLDR